jgi:hypothetical protein
VRNHLVESAIREKGDLAGAFEYDGRTGYFYLYDVREAENQKVLAFIRVISGNTDLADLEVSIRWDERQERVGLFLRGVQWVAFVAPIGAKHGGNFGPPANADIPAQQKFDG